MMNSIVVLLIFHLALPLVQANTATIPSTFFGMHTSGTTDWPQVSFGALGKGTLVSWPYIEQTKGVYDWSVLDNWVASAQAHSLSFFWSTDGIPPWATSDPSTCQETYTGSGVMQCTAMVKDTQDWRDFITALASRYGTRLSYELWNEPNTNYFTGTMQDMVTLTTHAYNIIRAQAPGATILAPSGTPSYMDGYFAAGGPRGVDVLTLHPIIPFPKVSSPILTRWPR
jgi:polysaccharide biosynthesis protein PslG